MMARSQGLFWLALQLSVAAAGAAGALLSAPAGVLLFLVLLPLNIVTLKKGWDARDNPQRNKTLADGLAVAGLLAFPALVFSHGLMTALGALLLATTLALNVQLNHYRKFYLLQLVSFVLLLVGAAEADSGSYLLVMAAYCLLAAFSLSEAWLDRGAATADLPGPGAGQRAGMALLSMALAVIFYLLIPRLAPLHWGAQESSAADFYQNSAWEGSARQSFADPYQPPAAPQNSSQQQYDQLQEITDLSQINHDGYRYDGFNESFDIRNPERSGLVDLNAVVARMKATHGTYLKVRTFDTFDGSRWHSAREDISRKLHTDRSGKAVINPAAEQQAAATRFRYTITIEQPMPAWLPVAPDPVALWVPSTVIALDQFAQPLLPGMLQPGMRYTVSSTDERQDKRLVSHATAAGKADLQLPRDFDSRILRLAYQVTAAGKSPYEKAQLLEQHLRNGYEYSFDSVLSSQGYTPLSRFLFDDKQGHCEHFASAMTIMLRSLNIPARLVTGFSASSQNPLTGYFEIRAIDGHAWSEAWIDGRWVTFEPTAYYHLPDGQPGTSVAEQISRYAEDIQHRQQQAGAGEFSGSALLGSLWLMLSHGVILLLAFLRLLLVSLWPLWLLLALAGVLAWFSRRYWLPPLYAAISRWKIKHYQPRDAAAALRFYLWHLQRISQCRLPARPSSQLLHEWLLQVQQVYGEQAALQRLAELVDAVIYGGQQVDTEEIRRLVAEVSFSHR